MSYFNLFILGFHEVYAHWFRSVLTILGVILGVASVVTMSAIVEGLEKGMRDNIIIYGGLNKVLIRDSDPPDYQNHIADTSPGNLVKNLRQPCLKSEKYVIGSAWKNPMLFT